VAVVSCSEIAEQRFGPLTYFDDVVWPSYLKCLGEHQLQHDSGIGKPPRCDSLVQHWLTVSLQRCTTAQMLSFNIATNVPPLLLLLLLLILLTLPFDPFTAMKKIVPTPGVSGQNQTF